MLKNIPGTELWDIRYGWGRVIEVPGTKDTLWVEFRGKISAIPYTLDGKTSKTDLNPVLFAQELNLSNL